MSNPSPQRLKKSLKLLDVYALATGTTLSAGLFLLPGIAAINAGSAITLSYLIAVLPLIPATFCIVELTTAMPKAGGVYYFLDRSMGPLLGTIGGIGTWLAMVLKVAFALIGIGVYLGLFIPELPIVSVAIGIAIALGILNILGADTSGKLQIVLVFLVILALAVLIGSAVPELNFSHFNNYLEPGSGAIISTAALVYISYSGITKVTSLSEEVENPERNLPLGIFLALGTAILIYGIGTAVMVGIVPMEKLAGDLSPVATVAETLFGRVGVIVISIAALFAFISVANAGTMSASRYPLAMSRDFMMPSFLQRLGKNGTPLNAIVFTVATTVVILLVLDTTGIVKIASAFQLLMFMLVCVAVIVMRESKIDSYDPSYLSPFYPWMPIFGIFSSLWLFSNMSAWTKVLTMGFLVIGVLWYRYYVRNKVGRSGAIYHIFEKLGQSRYEGLDRELRGILKEKELRKDDPFDQLVARSQVIDLAKGIEFEDIVERVSTLFSQFVPESYDNLYRQFFEGTVLGVTPVAHGAALPHSRVEGLNQMEMVMVRSKSGVHVKVNNPATDEQEEQILHAIFFLLSPLDNPTQHVRMLAQVARQIENENFMDDWMVAEDEQQLKESILHNERFHSLYIHKDGPTEKLIGKPLSSINMPEGSLVALIRRGEQTIIPRGSTIIHEYDRITVIGEPSSMREFHKTYIG